MVHSLRRQCGAALLILAAILVLGSTYLILARLNSQNSLLARQRAHNAEVLNRAKQALIGYIAMRAEKAGEQDPGALPCPEAAADYSNVANEGRAAANCTLPAAGRFPWRTLGLDKLVDASGEPLWYAVSSGWAKPSSTVNTVINSNSVGQLTVDGAANDSVAVIIAPGAPLAGQTRNAATAAVTNYLDGENATPADGVLVTTDPVTTFNDQVLRVTTRDVLPSIEAAISRRIEREIVPALKTVYASAVWGTNISPANPAYPFPALFADPGVGSSFKGSAGACSAGVCQGLLPITFTNALGSGSLCTSADGPTCDPMFVRWESGTIEVMSVEVLGYGTYVPGAIPLTSMVWNPTPRNCVVSQVPAMNPQTTRLDCTAAVPGLLGVLSTNVIYEVRALASNVGMSLRQFDPSPVYSMAGISVTSAPTVAMDGSGNAMMTFRGSTSAPTSAGLLSTAACGLSGILVAGIECRSVMISIPLFESSVSRSIFPDHAILDAEDPTLGWFMRNEWYRVLYYAAVESATPATLPAAPGCTPGINCLTLNGANDKRALLLLAGRSLGGTVGNTRALADYLDTAENRNGDGIFGTLPVGASFNDRAVVVQSN